MVNCGEKIEKKVKCISIRQDQEEFLVSQRKLFNLSKFVQAKLDDYIKLLNEYKQFVEVENEEKI